MKKSRGYKKRRRPLRWGILAAVVIAMLAIIAGIAWYEASAPGFILEPKGQKGYALGIRPIEAEGPIGYVVVEKKQLGRNARLYQRFSGVYLVDETYVIYASEEYTKAYNQYHGTDYTCFALTEIPQVGVRFTGYHEKIYPYDSANMTCYWEEYKDEGGGIYYKNAATGHRLEIWGASVFNTHR